MPATIIGSPASGGKVLRRHNYAKDYNGLETISETYLVRTPDLLTISPAKDTRHSVFSSASIKYPRMVVETVASNEMDGGITELNVQYVGLTSSSGLPPPVLRFLPRVGVGVWGPDIEIEVEFVTDSTGAQLMSGIISSTSAIAQPITGNVVSETSGGTTITRFRRTKIPGQINGVAMPPNPKEPYSQQPTPRSPIGLIYFGYCLYDSQATQRGLFNVARLTYAEFFQIG